MLKQGAERSVLTTHPEGGRPFVWTRHGRVVRPRPTPITSQRKSSGTQYIMTLALLIVGFVLKPRVLAVCRYALGTSRTTEKVAALNLHQRYTGTRYTTTVALLVLGLMSPVFLIVSRPFGYASVSMALASSAMCGAVAWLSWKKHSHGTIPSLVPTPHARSK